MQYTRSGSFQVDRNGNLTTATGQLVQGWTEQGGVLNTNGPAGAITVPTGTIKPPLATQNFSLAMNLNSAASGTQPNTFSTSIQVYDSLGTPHTLTAQFTESSTPGQWNYHESRGAEAPLAAVADAPDTRVLRGAVYRIVRTDGSVEYTNLRPAGQKDHAVTMLFTYIASCVACDLHSTIRWGSVSLNLTAYADTIRAASIEYGVDEAFLRAIIHAESAFNPRALSLKGAQGLMQLMPGTASDMGVLDAFNSDQNIRGGARYLGLLLHDFDGSERLAAAAYNAGPGAVQRYKGVPPYAETQVYVERVSTLRKRYGAAIHPPLASRVPG